MKSWKNWIPIKYCLLLFFFIDSTWYSYVLLNRAAAGEYVLLAQCLKWVYYIGVEVSIIIMGWKALKKDMTAESIVNCSSIFVLSQFAAVTVLKLYNSDILVWNILQKWQFCIPFMITIGISLCRRKKAATVPSLFKWGILIFLLLLPVLCSLNSFIYAVLVNGHKTREAEVKMDFLMEANQYIQFLYYLAVRVIIVVMGIRLLSGKMQVDKYTGLGGIYIIGQYMVLGISTYLLEMFREFSASSINMPLHILMSPRYIDWALGWYLGFLFLRLLRIIFNRLKKGRQT